jgi:hypothetical protein
MFNLLMPNDDFSHYRMNVMVSDTLLTKFVKKHAVVALIMTFKPGPMGCPDYLNLGR